MLAKRKGYRVERKVKLDFEKKNWRVLRAGGSLGEADLICIRGGKCILLQIKSTTKNALYYYGYAKKYLEKFPFYIVVDFGYGKVKILHPKSKINPEDGIDLKDFLEKN